MNKFYLSLLLFIFSASVFAQQNNFTITETYFEGQKVKFFSENRGGAVLVLDDYSVHLMNKNKEFSEVTNLFDASILQDISCIEAVNERVFLLGTNNNSLLMYEDGEILLLKDLNPELPLQINSIDFEGIQSDEQVLLATSDNIWASRDMRTYTRRNWMYVNNAKFYSGRNTALLSDYYSNCYGKQGSVGLQLTRLSHTILFGIYEDDSFSIEELNDVNLVRVGGGSSFYNTFAFYGTKNGLYTQQLSYCGIDIKCHFSNVAVHDLEIVSSGLARSAMFAASDSGLLYLEAGNYYFSTYDPEYFRLTGIDSAFTVDYSRFHNTIWVGTNNGLIQLSDSLLTHESMEPKSIAYDTINLCTDQGAYIYTELNDQLDIQWFRNGEEIQGALSRTYYTQQEGLYSVRFTYEDSLYDYNVTFAQLDSTFNERINKQVYKICPDSYSTYITISNDNYLHEYDWYSVERGLEAENVQYYSFETTEAGNYYFVATNCNGYTYQSDTVKVVKSEMEQPYFSNSSWGQDFCAGDTLFLNGAGNSEDLIWVVDYEELDNNQPFLVVEPQHAYSYVTVTALDQYGCELYASTHIDNVQEAPFLSIDQRKVTICNPTDFVDLDVPSGSTVYWEGYRDGQYYKVASGSYPVTVTNGICDDYQTNIEVEYLHPYSSLINTTLMVNDTFKVNLIDSLSITWNRVFRQSDDGSFIYITSSTPKTFEAEVLVLSKDCNKSYTFEVVFESPLPLAVVRNNLNLNIYPNPASEGVIVAMDQLNVSSIQLLNLHGKLVVEKQNIKQGNIHFKFPDGLESGAYLLRIYTNNNDYITRKIIVN